MLDDWTIDTLVLYECARLDTSAICFLSNILYKRKNVVFDTSNYIKDQYEDCIRTTKKDAKMYPGNAFVEKWFKHAVNMLAVKNNGYLQEMHRIGLMSKKFHDDDLMFVAACHCSNDKRLVSKDSDYTQDIIDYLSEEMQIKFTTVDNALKIL